MTASMSWELVQDRPSTALLKEMGDASLTRAGKIMRRLLRDVVEHGEPQGDTSAMEDESGLKSVQEAVRPAQDPGSVTR